MTTKTEEMQAWSDSLWRAKNYHLQREATAAYRRAIVRGELEPPFSCEDCGRGDRRLHGHHEDYAYPLEVAFLCPFCHSARHRFREFFLESRGEDAA